MRDRIMTVNENQEVIKDIMDVYPHIVGRKTKCWCGKELPKGTEAFIAVLHPNPDGFWLNHKVICSFECDGLDASVKKR